jgi:hypothetical protein
MNTLISRIVQGFSYSKIVLTLLELTLILLGNTIYLRYLVR